MLAAAQAAYIHLSRAKGSVIMRGRDKFESFTGFDRTLENFGLGPKVGGTMLTESIRAGVIVDPISEGLRAATVETRSGDLRPNFVELASAAARLTLGSETTYRGGASGWQHMDLTPDGFGTYRVFVPGVSQTFVMGSLAPVTSTAFPLALTGTIPTSRGVALQTASTSLVMDETLGTINLGMALIPGAPELSISVLGATVSYAGNTVKVGPEGVVISSATAIALSGNVTITGSLNAASIQTAAILAGAGSFGDLDFGGSRPMSSGPGSAFAVVSAAIASSISAGAGSGSGGGATTAASTFTGGDTARGSGGGLDMGSFGSLAVGAGAGFLMGSRSSGSSGGDSGGGSPGPVGPQGPAGADGADGATGPAGATGAAGTDGADGADGADSTVPGPTGPTGATGPAGAAGSDGTDGGDPELQVALVVTNPLADQTVGQTYPAGTSLEAILRDMLIAYQLPAFASLNPIASGTLEHGTAYAWTSPVTFNTTNTENVDASSGNIYFKKSSTVLQSSAFTFATGTGTVAQSVTFAVPVGDFEVVATNAGQSGTAKSSQYTIRTEGNNTNGGGFSGQDTLNVYFRTYFGATATQFTGSNGASVTSALAGGTENDSKRTVTCTADNANGSNYTYFAMPTCHFDAVSSIVLNGAIPVYSAFTSKGTDTVNGVEYTFFESNAPGAFSSGDSLVVS